MATEIVPLAPSHFEDLRLALDVVAREKRYLAFQQAPPREEAFAFYRHIVENDLCHFVVLVDGKVSGWCDVLPTRGEARAHVGILGIGLIPSARHQGIGEELMRIAISDAWARGMSRIELTVRADNFNAKALYERMGFKTEGLSKRAFLVDGVFYDSHSMALLLR
ncbi:MAG TPA: GNAT family N-acetyltransferase [Thermoanaerobaculia bacterium]|jgi:putative acetyltransferase